MMGTTNPPQQPIAEERLEEACKRSFFARNILKAFESKNPDASASARKPVIELICTIAGV